MSLPRAGEKAAASGAAHRPARPRQLPQVLDWHRVRRSLPIATCRLACRRWSTIASEAAISEGRRVPSRHHGHAHYPAAMVQLSKHVISEVRAARWK